MTLFGGPHLDYYCICLNNSFVVLSFADSLHVSIDILTEFSRLQLTDECVRMCLVVKRYSMALHAGELQTLSIFELLEYIVSEVSCLHSADILLVVLVSASSCSEQLHSWYVDHMMLIHWYTWSTNRRYFSSNGWSSVLSYLLKKQPKPWVYFCGVSSHLFVI